MYNAILVLNKDNFDVNYRLGILSLTLQNLDDSFKYLDYAMRLKKDDPRVIYQMGVLLFSSGKRKEAMEYFNRALRLNEASPSLYFYLGLCNEDLGKLSDAKMYYDKAHLADPNDINIIASIDRINEKIAREKERQKLLNRGEVKINQNEAEEGEVVPLPISENARKVRLKNDEKVEDENKTDNAGGPNK